MTRTQLENVYKAHGLHDYKLKTTDDLLKIHGIDYKSIDGYNRLDELNQNIYKTFIINFYNAHGLDNRNIIPKGIYYVEDTTLLNKKIDEYSEEYYSVVGSHILAIDRNGIKTVHTHTIFENCNEKDIIEEPPKTYLRFQYQQGYMDDGEPRMAWMHVVDGGYAWY